LYLIIQIRFLLSSSKTNYFGILLKQFLTHWQQISIISVLDFSWTPDFKSYFNIQSFISFISDDLFNIECFALNINGNSYLKNVTLIIILPIIMCSIFSIILLIEQIFYIISSKPSMDFKRIPGDLATCLIVIAFILFPEITRKCFSLLNCMDIDDSGTKKLLRFSPDIECWTDYHYFYILTLALPGFFIWGILYPSATFIILYRYKFPTKQIIKDSKIQEDSQKDSKIQEDSQKDQPSQHTIKSTKETTKYGKRFMDSHSGKESKIEVFLKFIYKGYREECYYWEYVLFIKKIILIFIGSFTDFFPNESKATILLALICIFLLLQVRIQPYENPYLNQIEFFSLFVTFLTANFGLLLYSEDFKSISAVMLAIMILIHVSFICFWTYVFIVFRRKSSRMRREKSQKNE
jgi:hypothetical protein